MKEFEQKHAPDDCFTGLHRATGRVAHSCAVGHPGIEQRNKNLPYPLFYKEGNIKLPPLAKGDKGGFYRRYFSQLGVANPISISAD